MTDIEPTQWSVDSYDGGTTWIDVQTMPDKRYEGDISPTRIQQRELRAALMQSEMEADTLMETEANQDQRREQWKCIKDKVRMTCTEMYNRLGYINAITEEMAQTNQETCYNEPEEVRNHERGIQSEDDHVEITHAIGNHEEDTHVYNHNRRHNVARQLEVTPTTQSSSVSELNPRSNHHVETSRDAMNHDAKIHEGSDDGNTAITLLHGQGGEHTNAIRSWCSAGQAYRIIEWSCWYVEHEDSVEEKQDKVIKNGLDRCIASLMLGKTGRRQGLRSQRDEYDDEDSKSEDEQLVCNVSGNTWESLPFPVIIDSGGMCVSHAHGLAPTCGNNKYI